MKCNALVILISIAVATGLLGGCTEDNTQSQIDLEKSSRATYVASLSPAVTPTADGLYYIQGRTGIGTAPQTGDSVYIYYTTRILNGNVFDQRLRPNSPYGFIVGNGSVIAGLDEGVKLMRVGDTAKLLIPSSLGYGATKNGVIPAYSNLLFDVELIKVKPN